MTFSPEIQTSADEMMEWIEEITSFGIRRPGTAADLAVEDFVVDRFQDFGLSDIRKEPVPVNACKAREARFVFDDEQRLFPACSVPYTNWTEAAGIRTGTVFVGCGTPSDFESADVAGKIVVAEIRFAEFSATFLKEHAVHAHDTDGSIPDGVLHAANWLITNFSAYYTAHMRGAAGFVGLLVDAPVDGCDYWVPYDGFLKELPAVWIGREHAQSVRFLAEKGAQGRLVSVGETQQVDSHNVVGCVAGQGEEAIVLTCHHDAPFASAVEDASGLAVLLALAKLYGPHAGKLKRSLVFVASSGHFHGGIGNRVFVETHRDGLLPNVVAALGMEHFAEEAASDGAGGYQLTGLPEVRALFTEGDALVNLVKANLVAGELERALVIPPYVFGPEPPCDSAPFFTAGVPSMCHISGPLYLFDPHDTLDKVRVSDLEPAVRFYTRLIAGMEGLSKSELETGLSRRRDDPPAPPPHWFLPPEGYLNG